MKSTLKHFHSCLPLSVGVYPLREWGAGLFQLETGQCVVRDTLNLGCTERYYQPMPSEPPHDMSVLSAHVFSIHPMVRLYSNGWVYVRICSITSN